MCVCLCVFACVCVFVQVCIATVCVRKDAGDRTAPTAAPVRTEAPAPRRTAPACARRDTEAPTADGVKKHNNTQHTHTHSSTVQKKRKLLIKETILLSKVSAFRFQIRVKHQPQVDFVCWIHFLSCKHLQILFFMEET